MSSTDVSFSYLFSLHIIYFFVCILWLIFLRWHMSARLIQRTKSTNGSESEASFNGVVHKLNGNDQSKDGMSPEASLKSPPSEETSCKTPLINPQVHSHGHAHRFCNFLTKIAASTSSHLKSFGHFDLYYVIINNKALSHQFGVWLKRVLC